MIYIVLPTKETRRLSFYLAAEEYVARQLNDDDDCFFMWQVRPSVIFGRNQVVEAEVNLEFCRQRGIETYRRKSGGGCVYADMKNIMFSYITRDEHVNFTFNRYINLVRFVLCKLGIEARATGRNDILIDGRKVSGNAFYHLAGHSIVHGTMLYDTTMENMVGAITPSDEKLQSKGVKSVRQHIALLKDYTSLSLEEFKNHVRTTLCNKEHVLSDADVAAIEAMEQEYLSEEFIFGRNPAFSVQRRRRIPEVGEVEIRMEVRGDTIRNVNLVGDYFLIGDLDGLLLKPLKGVKLSEADLRKALPERLDGIVRNLKTDDFINLILNK